MATITSSTAPTITTVQPASKGFDGISLVIGILIGAIIVLIIVFILYLARVFIFSYCPTETKICAGADYYNDPGDALATGANINDILFINDQGLMFYKRVPSNQYCIPSDDQIVQVAYPQYCSFDISGVDQTAKALQFQSPAYETLGTDIFVNTEGNCVPVPNSVASSGVPILKWDQ